MAITEELDVVIARPAGEVFDHLVDVERWPEWLIASGITAVERAPGVPLAVGARLQIHQVLAGVRSSVVRAEVKAFEPGARFMVAGKDADGVSIAIDAALTPEDGGTRLRWRLKVDLPLKYRMFERMAAPQLRRAAALDLEAFRRRLGAIAET